MFPFPFRTRRQRQLDRIEWMLVRLLHLETTTMTKIDDLVQAVADEKTVEDSAIALLETLHQQLTDALASGDPAKIQAVIDSISVNKQALADAVTANTPAAPGGGQ